MILTPNIPEHFRRMKAYAQRPVIVFYFRRNEAVADPRLVERLCEAHRHRLIPSDFIDAHVSDPYPAPGDVKVTLTARFHQPPQESLYDRAIERPAHLRA